MKEIKNAIEEHLEVLRNKIFQTRTKWPQFELLLSDLTALSNSLPSDSNVISMERTLLYGGFSLIAPIFSNQKFISLDCSPVSAEERGAYNSSMLENDKFIKIPYTSRVSLENTGLESNQADVILIPNLMHHVKEQDLVFKEAYRILKPGGIIYIFEALVRELHQIPDDYIRYTPYGLRHTLKRFGFSPEKEKTIGGPFSVIAYSWIQALEYFPEEAREKMSDWFYSTQFPELMIFDKQYQKNLVRKHTSFPAAFSIVGIK